MSGKPETKRQRWQLLDSIRGLTLVSMILYHGTWDLVYLYGVRWRWFLGRGAFLWQQSICWTFILLSGFCWGLGKRPLQRSLTVFGAGALVTAVTLLFMPAERVICGVLFLLGGSGLLLVPLHKTLKCVPVLAGLLISFLLFLFLYQLPQGVVGFGPWRTALPAGLYRSRAGVPFGFPPPDFFSSDYFPLLPWFFLFAAGYFLWRLFAEKGPSPALARSLTFGIAPLSFLGRHSLIIYLLHQPLLYGCLWALSALTGLF